MTHCGQPSVWIYSHGQIIAVVLLLFPCFTGGRSQTPSWLHESANASPLLASPFWFLARCDWDGAGGEVRLRLIGRIRRVSVCWLESQSVGSRLTRFCILFPLQLEVPGDHISSKSFLYLYLDHTQPLSAVWRSVHQSVLAFDWFDFLTPCSKGYKVRLWA